MGKKDMGCRTFVYGNVDDNDEDDADDHDDNVDFFHSFIHALMVSTESSASL